MAFWLIKADPRKYGWGKLVEEKRTAGDWVENPLAMNNLKKMEKGDELSSITAPEASKL